LIPTTRTLLFALEGDEGAIGGVTNPALDIAETRESKAIEL